MIVLFVRLPVKHQRKKEEAFYPSKARLDSGNAIFGVLTNESCVSSILKN